MDDLDLPVQTTYGSLGKLVLKIPWKNLYKAPVECTIENLYLLAKPNQDVAYNEEKEKKSEFDSKKAELLRIEEAKKKEDEKDAPVVDKSFTEKLATQIINNVQIKIKDIHIRYEDTSTTSTPFAFGVTLRNLIVHTTDGNWKQCLMSEAINQVFKIAELEGLAIYMNCNTNTFASSPESQFPKLFTDAIATKDQQPDGFNYILGPITSMAKLEINPNPEADGFVTPKIQLQLSMEKLGIGITRSQYQDIIQLGEKMDRMMKGSNYRKYRPHGIKYRGNYKVWWKFAFDSVLHDVRRRKNNWSWDHMLEHRNLCKSYADVYKNKMTVKKVSSELVATCDFYEEKLDLFSLVVIRQRIELEVSF